MKYKKVIITILFFIPLVLSAQKFHYGFKAGLSFTSAFHKGISFDFFSKKGLMINSYANYSFIKGFSVQSELSFEQYRIEQDYKKCQLGSIWYTDINYKLNYLKIPILLKYDIGKKLKFYFNSGIYLGFLFSARENGIFNIYEEFKPLISVEYSDRTVHDRFDKTDTGVIFGTGLEIITNKSLDVIIETRYYYSLLTYEFDCYENYWIRDLRSLVIGIGVNLK
jgi:hypothetical protein